MGTVEGKRRRRQSALDTDAPAVATAEDDDTDDEGGAVVVLPSSQSRGRRQLLPVLEGGPMMMSGYKCGRLTSVDVENFMCHNRLVLDLHPTTNFITGENGAGKSAICAAVQMCLGSRAASTHRGDSLGNLVKHGSADEAILRVTLSNEGEGAFKPELFGARVTVERVISKSRASTYCLRNAKGAVVSRKKGDLDDLLNALDIHVSNPMVVMDQETSKKFLYSKPKQKYQFFTEATSLASVRAALDDLEVEMLNTCNVVAGCKPMARKWKHAVREAKARYDEAKAACALDDKIHAVDLRLMWVATREEEESAEAQRVLLQELEGKADATRAKAQNLQADIEGMRAKLEAVKEDAANAQAKRDEFDAMLKVVSKRISVEKGRKATLEREINSARGHIAALTKRLVAAEAERARRPRVDPSSVEAAIQDKRAKVEAADLRVDACMKRQDQIRSDIASVEDRLATARAALGVANGVLQQAERDARTVAQRLEYLRSAGARDNPVARYGEAFVRLNAAIEACPDFEVRPVGPVGAHARLLPEYEGWLKAMEAVLASKSKSYVVHSFADGKRLAAMADRFGLRDLQYTVLKHQAHAPRIDPRPPGVLFAHTTLHVENPWVWTYILDSTRLDTIALTETHRTAEKLLVTRADGYRNYMDGVSFAIDREGGRHTSRRGGVTNIPPSNSHSQYLSVRPETQLAEQEAQARRAQGKVEQAAQAKDEARSIVGPIEVELRALVQQDTLCTQELARAERELQQAHAIVVPVMEDADELAVQADEAIQELKDEVTDIDSGLQERVVALAKSEELLRTSSEEGAEIQRSIDRLNADQLERALQKILSGIKEKERSLHSENIRLDTAVQNLAAETAAVQKLDASVRTRRAQVIEATGMVEPPRGLETREVLNATKALLEKKREQFQYTKEEVEERKLTFRLIYEAYEALKGAETALRENIRLLGEEEDFCKQEFERSKVMYGATVGSHYQVMLRQKKHTGHVDFDHKDGSLIPTMIPNSSGVDKNTMQNTAAMAFADDGEHEDEDFEGGREFEDEARRSSPGEGKKKKAGEPGDRSAVQLSGGERSFMTLSLLCAIGSTLTVPFRILDEFDVFMDDSMRKLAIDLLVASTRRQDVQAIFISPHQIFVDDDKCKVWRLEAPRARAGAAPAGAGAAH